MPEQHHRRSNRLQVEVIAIFGERVSAAFSGTAQRVLLPQGPRGWTLVPIGGDCLVEFGDQTVEASSSSPGPLLERERVDIDAKQNTTHISVIGYGGGTGTLEITALL